MILKIFLIFEVFEPGDSYKKDFHKKTRCINTLASNIK